MACSSYVGDQSDQAHRDEQRSHACRSAGGRTATAAPDPSPEDQEGACCAACAALPSARARRADGCAPQSYTLEEELQLKKVVDREAKRAERENDRLKAERRARLEAQQKLFIQRQQRSQLERKVQELEDAYFAGGVSALQTTLRSIGPTGVTARVSARALPGAPCARAHALFPVLRSRLARPHVRAPVQHVPCVVARRRNGGSRLSGCC